MDYCVGRMNNGGVTILGFRYPYLVQVLFDEEDSFSELRVRPLGIKAPSIYPHGPYIIEDPIYLDSVHQLLSAWKAECRFIEETVVAIQRFFIPELLIGIEDLPRHLVKFLDDPSAFSTDEQSNYPQIIQEWRTDGCCVFWWGRDYYLSSDGEVI
jgi:hypothetical protein